MATKILLAVTVVCGFAEIGTAGIGYVDYGSSARPGTVAGTIVMTPAPFNPGLYSDVRKTPDGCGGDISFSAPVKVLKVGTGWSSWSGGYTGNVFYTNGATSLTLTYAPGMKAVQLYAGPNPFGIFRFCATGTASDGSRITSCLEPAPGSPDRGWGFYGTGGASIVSVTITCDVDFAVGDLACSGTPACRADLNGDGLVDFADYLEFLNLFYALDPRVDFNGDGLIDFSDYLEFLNLFEVGC